MTPKTLDRAGERLHQALVEPVRYLVEAGGTRWRPQLLLSVIDLLGGDSTRYLPLAAAMELMHTGSLMVDDVQDEARLRRGRASAHTVFGAAITLNAGTAAYFTFDHALRITLPHDAALRSAVYETCLGALRAAHAGQGLDLAGHRTEMDASVATGRGREVLELVRVTHRLKSGAPVRACMEAGALLAGADLKMRATIGAFGEAVGTSYQIIDDVLDLQGVIRRGTATKQAGEDLFNGKVTMPLAHAVELLDQPQMRKLWRGLRDGRATGRRVRRAIAVLRACGALQASTNEAHTTLERSWEPLADLIGNSEKAHSLWTMASQAVRRSRIA
ncbi:polyprenyl synthetase family protein [Streptomyces sp. Tu 2975]|uniref:polyprenyl synthetase family protein n=1 Tax=Streptomyces sp. Tu 2975 TaxID=2676871 RepID=UPI00135A5001|nr:polyprenyl synthetase family protein [Streptomyces sp. Tu 2975]QIP82781.1 polyprenyl synthetase family protein [Streptomyces sp. Tu 2975]